MGFRIPIRQSVVAALLISAAFSVPLSAEDRSQELLAELKNADAAAATRIIREIELEWSQSGSVALNMLLQRGREALDEEEYRAAVDHLTALTDHAPGFAEGWHSRARAFFGLDLYGPAIDDLGMALRLNPNHFQALFGLGVLLAEIGETAHAEQAFRRALELHPHFEEAQEALKRLERDGIGRSL